MCSNPKREQPIRNDRWDTHVLKATSDKRLQESPEDVLERSMNFAPDGEWDNKESRMQRIVTFMEQRHYLALARQYGETDLAKKITEQAKNGKLSVTFNDLEKSPEEILEEIKAETKEELEEVA